MGHIDDLKDRLIGRTICDVVDPQRGGVLFRLECSDSSSVTIVACEGGFSIEDQEITSLGSLFEQVCQYRTFSPHRMNVSSIEQLPIPKVTIDDGVINIDAFDGTTYCASISSLKDKWEQTIASHPSAPEFLPHLVDTGNFWKMLFSKGEGRSLPGLPPELLVD